MKKNIFAGMVAAVCIAAGSVFPFSASAQSVTDIQAQIQALLARIRDLTGQISAQQGGAIATSTGQAQIDRAFSQPGRRVCSALYRNLGRGVSGDDVQSLQEFLREEGYFTVNGTGYFGPVTAQAVASWQASQGLPPVGIFGPLSRERVRVWCGGGTPVCTSEYSPVCGSKPIVCITTPCNPIQQTYSNRCAMNADGATFLYEGQCRVDPQQAPTISSFSGPTTLAVNTSGTWTIQARDPENQPLSYHITWGDESSLPLSPESLAMRGAFVQTTTFTHAYASAGTYTVTIVVRDATGKEARASATVQVGGDLVFCTMQYDPVCGQPPPPACVYSIPACLVQLAPPQTYGNVCLLNAAGATLLYRGQCATAY